MFMNWEFDSTIRNIEVDYDLSTPFDKIICLIWGGWKFLCILYMYRDIIASYSCFIHDYTSLHKPLYIQSYRYYYMVYTCNRYMYINWHSYIWCNRYTYEYERLGTYCEHMSHNTNFTVGMTVLPGMYGVWGLYLHTYIHIHRIIILPVQTVCTHTLHNICIVYIWYWYISRMNIDSPHICVHCTMYIHNDVDLKREREKTMIITGYLYMLLFISGDVFLGSIQLQLKINNVQNRCLGGGGIEEIIPHPLPILFTHGNHIFQILLIQWQNTIIQKDLLGISYKFEHFYMSGGVIPPPLPCIIKGGDKERGRCHE